MFRTAPISERKPSALDKATGLGNHPSTSSLESPSVSSLKTYPTRGPRRYPHRLNFYTAPPISEVTVEQFESWAIDRLRVLAEIESSTARNRPWPELKEAVGTLSKKHLPLSANTTKGAHLDAERLKDHVSHFVLRLAFCRSEELRRRFIKAETCLFRLRFDADDARERQDFLSTLSFEWKPVSAEEKADNREKLLQISPRLHSSWEHETFFKVHWTRVTDLVEKRRVFLQGGIAWVSMREQSSLVIQEFQSRLSKELELTARAIPRLDEDDRLLPVLSHLSMGFLAGISSDLTSVGSLLTESGETITAAMVDTLVRQHAPLCMRHLHETLRVQKHLKHFGRLQYNLFLKELGLPIEEALLFWRRAFSNMTDDKFNKEHKYNIRHGYGLEGKRNNYPAKSCARILTQDTPGPTDSHGCPFRHFSQANLSAALSTHYALSAVEQSEILAASKAGHYHVSCTRLFELKHRSKKGDGLGGGESVSHPNRYFEKSWSISRDSGQSGNEGSVGESHTEAALQPTIASPLAASAATQEANSTPAIELKLLDI